MFKRTVLMAALAAWLMVPLHQAAAQQEAHEVEVTTKVSAVARSHETSHAASDAHGGEHKEYPLLPELDDRSEWLQALWVVIIFIVLLIILYPTAWKNVLAGLKAREARIRKDIADAEAARAKAEATLKEYNAQLATAEGKVRDMLTKAAAEAERIATGIRMQSQQEAEEIKERATRDIETARKAAMVEFKQFVASVSTSVAEKILRRNLNADDQRELVNRSLEQLQEIGKA